MKPGDLVEVNRVWASQGRLLPPLRGWAKGFEFVELDGPYVVVRFLEGLYAGMDANYPAQDVRPAVEPLPRPA
jgi:hypothetical protein